VVGEHDDARQRGGPVPMLFIAGLIILFQRFRIHSVLFGLVMGVIGW
jgi:hypothetical protein